MDAHHRCAHAHAGHLGFEFALELAGVMRHIGRGAAHVKTNDLVNASDCRGARHADNAAGWATQDCIFSLKCVGIGKPAGRLHEKQFDTWHVASHLLDIAAQDGRQVRIDDGGIAPANKLHQRAGFMRGADLGEAHILCNACCGFFMASEPVAMHEHNRNAS